MTARARLDTSADVLRNASAAMVPFLKQRGLLAVVAAGFSSTADAFNVFPAIDRCMVRILLKRRSWLEVKLTRRSDGKAQTDFR
jgi:hypothetical protein